VTDDFDRALLPEVDLVIECLGGVEPAGSVIVAALAMRKAVATANKAAVAAYWPELAPSLREPNRRLWFSATVGGAVPMLEVLSRMHGRLRGLRGVISSTCNSVLDSIARGHSYNSAVHEAQAAGLTEGDPHRDLCGLDAADKLSLMARAGWGVHVAPDKITTRGVNGGIKSDEH